MQIQTLTIAGVGLIGGSLGLAARRRGIASHVLGVGRSAASLDRARLTVVTPGPRTDPATVERTAAFWQALGSRVRLMTPEEHDEALALTSHLPHLLASALAGILPDDCRDLAATGFRDTTRVAAGDPALWTAIFAQNRDAVLRALERLSGR